LPASPVDDFDADVTGVRTAPQAAEAAREVEGVQAEAARQDEAQAPPALELTPELTRPALVSPVTAVVDVIGAAQAFAPSTFAAWLDATLAL
jgi:hypothetical protein